MTHVVYTQFYLSSCSWVLVRSVSRVFFVFLLCISFCFRLVWCDLVRSSSSILVYEWIHKLVILRLWKYLCIFFVNFFFMPIELLYYNWITFVSSYWFCNFVCLTSYSKRVYNVVVICIFSYQFIQVQIQHCLHKTDLN